VFAPALPGFGGTADLPKADFSIEGYAAWVDGFLTAVDVEGPVFLIGHSFGGGVAIQTASDFPDRVRSLVLVNSLGGSMAGRPIWDWGVHFPSEVLPFQLTKVLPVVLEDAVPNLMRNPRAMWKVANLARKADLSEELEELKRRQLPVVVLWGDKDRIIPRSSFDDLCTTIGMEGEVVAGNHSWLLADPDAFGEVMTNVVGVAKLAYDLERKEREKAADRDERSAPRRLLARLPGIR
jgi:pimeloyl-ACP methyl ester carboxylesterase